VAFDPKFYNERPGLLEIGGTIYTTWGSHCDQGPYTSWVMSFSADTLKQTSVLNLVPNGNEGGIWMSGTAPAADAAGNIYFIVGNGDFGTTLDANGFPANANCGNCFAKISSSAPLKLLDYFTPLNTVSQSAADIDVGSGGPLLLPDVVDSNGATRHLALGSGKDANIYVLDRDNMGKFNASRDNIYQQISGQLAAAYSQSRAISTVPCTTARSVMRLRLFQPRTGSWQRHPRPKPRIFQVSRSHAKHFCKPYRRWDRLGRRKWRNRRAARLRRNQSR
jgi:hypothetical protein